MFCCCCHPSNLKVTWDDKSTIWLIFERFRTTAIIWIHGWLLYKKGFYEHGRGALYLSLSSVKFEGHTGRKIDDFALRLSRFSVIWIHGWLWNNSYRFCKHVKFALLFREFTRPIFSSHQPSNPRFGSDFAVGNSQFQFKDGYGMIHTALTGIEVVYYSSSSNTFQRYTSQTSSLGWLQLPNPLDLPC